MKALGLVVIAALAIGCSSTPTSPSVSAGTAVVAGDQDHKPNPGSDTHTIELYFLANGVDSRRPIGMPVSVRSASVDWQQLVVGGSGFVTIVIPAADTWIEYRFDSWNGICGDSDTISIPGGNRPHWHHTVNVKTGCATL